MFTGGDIVEISYKHPTLGGGTIFPKASEDFTVDPGGIVSNDEENGVTSDGQMIDQMNRKRWSMEGTVAWDMAVQDELAKVKALAKSTVPATWTFTHVNGTIWGGTGKPVGTVQGSTNNSTMKLKIAGGGELVKIS